MLGLSQRNDQIRFNIKDYTTALQSFAKDKLQSAASFNAWEAIEVVRRKSALSDRLPNHDPSDPQPYLLINREFKAPQLQIQPHQEFLKTMVLIY